jgi:hypothetical protein
MAHVAHVAHNANVNFSRRTGKTGNSIFFGGKILHLIKPKILATSNSEHLSTPRVITGCLAGSRNFF